MVKKGNLTRCKEFFFSSAQVSTFFFSSVLNIPPGSSCSSLVCYSMIFPADRLKWTSQSSSTPFTASNWAPCSCVSYTSLKAVSTYQFRFIWSEITNVGSIHPMFSHENSWITIILWCFAGMFRRITAAASRLLKGEACPEAGLYYPLEGLNSMVQSLVTTHPPLVLLWCQVLLIINYTNYSWWAEVHQTPRYRATRSDPAIFRILSQKSLVKKKRRKKTTNKNNVMGSLCEFKCA